MSDMESTRVIGATTGTPVAPGDRTMVAPAAGSADALRTQMGGTTTCPVCKSTTPMYETYCGECGFLLSSAVAEEIEAPVEEAPAAELVDSQSGRRYRLRQGDNTVGRQGTDVLVADSTVSRTHARITIEGDQITVEDLGSTNGTKVGDKRIGANEPTPAASGMPLKFGNWQVVLEVPGNVAAAAAPAAEQTVVLPGEEAAAGAEPPTEAASDRTPPAETVEAAPEEAPVETAAPVALLRKTGGPAGDIPITEGTITVGRRSTNTISLPEDPYISGAHAEITTDNTGTYLIDMGSTNGTLVNGQKLTPNERQLLLSGDEVQIGQTTYQFEHVEPSEESDQMTG
ncbi:MAG TPA: FHA domain-containing protein [Chthonomonadaceae bacterium]|nr:FHA domain-containing protein [Chthonomonadaceae bacterium]